MASERVGLLQAAMQKAHEARLKMEEDRDDLRDGVF